MRGIFAILLAIYMSFNAAAQQGEPQTTTAQPEARHAENHRVLGTPPTAVQLRFLPLSFDANTRTPSAQESSSARALSLEELEKMGLENNPTMCQAQAELRAAEARLRQAGLYPNPTIGYQGEQIRGGSFRGGEQGAFVQQEIVLGGKLSAARNIAEQERKQAEVEREEQKLRVVNGIRLAYYQALAAQQTVTLRSSLLKVAQDAAETSRQLFNVGQADQPDVLQAEIEAEQAQLGLEAARQRQQRIWKSLAATVGNPTLPFVPLAGDLEKIPDVNPDEWLQKLLGQSPAVRIAALGVERAKAQLSRAEKEPVPNLQLRGGIEQNKELLEGSARPVGIQGFAEVGIQIPLFNRNQGNIHAAKAGVDRAEMETKRVQLLLRERLAAVVQNYQTSKLTAERYRERMIPRAERAYKLYLEKYNSMTSSYPQVLIAQRTLLQLQADYVAALEAVWTNSVALQGYMVTDALEAPTPPTETDRPIRETDLPTSSMGPQR